MADKAHLKTTPFSEKPPLPRKSYSEKPPLPRTPSREKRVEPPFGKRVTSRLSPSPDSYIHKADKSQLKKTPSPENGVPPPSGKRVTLPSLSPPSGTCIVKLPRNQTHRFTSREMALRYVHLSRPKSSSRIYYMIFFSLLLFLVIMALSAAAFYIVFRPKSPNYTVKNVSIRFFNLTTLMSQSSSTPSPPPITPEFHINFTAENPSNKIGIYYEEEGSSVHVFYKNVHLFDGVLPQFYQPSENVTVFKAVLEGSSAMEITSSVHEKLVAAEKDGRVPLNLNLRAPVKFKVGSVKTWTMNVKVRCHVTVNEFTAQSKIVSQNCEYNGVHLW
ncbi:hypothetical protein Dsin_031907 [Dipteronia sinensis]|uniref:Late embryogenesis abundant protein LEA-2 subgroup domain-containing protein n=1 Tax=Dipteronia sinensis TaxID=43782 RepID=A0AAE0DSJ8_9ROSI|nr:hypothetical protein Dsin_031907 [Dipteronia sinensis]